MNEEIPEANNVQENSVASELKTEEKRGNKFSEDKILLIIFFLATVGLTAFIILTIDKDNADEQTETEDIIVDATEEEYEECNIYDLGNESECSISLKNNNYSFLFENSNYYIDGEKIDIRETLSVNDNYYVLYDALIFVGNDSVFGFYEDNYNYDLSTNEIFENIENKSFTFVDDSLTYSEDLFTYVFTEDGHTVFDVYFEDLQVVDDYVYLYNLDEFLALSGLSADTEITKRYNVDYYGKLTFGDITEETNVSGTLGSTFPSGDYTAIAIENLEDLITYTDPLFEIESGYYSLSDTIIGAEDFNSEFSDEYDNYVENNLTLKLAFLRSENYLTVFKIIPNSFDNTELISITSTLIDLNNNKIVTDREFFYEKLGTSFENIRNMEFYSNLGVIGSIEAVHINDDGSIIFLDTAPDLPWFKGFDYASLVREN